MSNGLKSLAQELPKYGRYGDSIVAHINPQEAALLKSLGGSGTINPTTGLPEFWGGLGALNPFNPGSAAGKAVSQIPGVSQLQNVATQALQPIEKAVVQPVSNALVDVDKSVAKMVPGGWGTVGMVAGSMMGLPTYAMVGLGALNGSGVMHPGRGFNLQGAVMGGAMAYGMSSLGEYMRAAAPAAEGASSTLESLPVSESAAPPTGSIEEALPNNYGAPQPTGYTAGANGGIQPTYDASAPIVEPPVAPPTASAPYEPPPFDPNYDPNAGIRQPISESLARGDIGDAIKTAASDVGKYASNVGTGIKEGVVSAYDAATNPSTYTNAIDKGMSNAGQTMEGIKNLISGPAGTSAAASAASGVNPLLATAATVYGGMGLSDAEAQYQYLKDQLAQGNIAQAEYDKLAAEVERSTQDARNAVAAHPFSTTPNRDVSIGETYYGRSNDLDNLYSRMTGESRLYAVGGSVDDESGMDEARGLNAGNLQNGFMGGGVPSYASGGVARFLSGGGDGMSDSIPATINGNQEARLADGEFVIPADVVSHLGNGSSKAGAKQLYSMMDKVRTARTGRKQQGKQINPRKYLPA